MNCLAKRKKTINKKPVWRDEDPDENEKVQLDDEEEQEDEDEVDEYASSTDSDDELYAGDVRSKKLKLDNRGLQYKHLVDLNNERSFNGSVQQVQFHPDSKIALVSLGHSQADLFEVDGERNRYIQNIRLPRANRPYCSFTPDGKSVVITSETYKGKFYTYDMVSTEIQEYDLKSGYDMIETTDFVMNSDLMACRKQGSQSVMFLSTKTYENSFSIRINDPVKQVHFTKGDDLFIAGENSQVYIWDLRKTNVCKHKFTDEGAVHITSLSLSETSQLLSIGSDSGVVNTYELGSCLANKFPTPTKTFMNLKTPINILHYNATGELLLMGSSHEQGAFRMIHSHSGTVYRNFPQAQKRYGKLFSANFSPLSGYLALGCSTGRAHLCRLPYYKLY